ncbi:MAG: hypothetical protein NE334_06720 [Lentisphaeraceae bacterium]|nr:hypothetical protein [Lentisphaeraceae bacterium]
MKKLSILIFSLLFSAQLSAKEVTIGGIRLDVPDFMEMKVLRAGFHSFSWGKGMLKAQFMFYQYPVNIELDKMDGMMKTMSASFKKQMMKHGNINIVAEDKKKVAYGSLRGIELHFTLNAGMKDFYQSMIIFSDGTKTYSGQLTAHTKEQVDTARRVLASSILK